jgi:hypothetical protein
MRISYSCLTHAMCSGLAGCSMAVVFILWHSWQSSWTLVGSEELPEMWSISLPGSPESTQRSSFRLVHRMESGIASPNVQSGDRVKNPGIDPFSGDPSEPRP